MVSCVCTCLPTAHNNLKNFLLLQAQAPGKDTWAGISMRGTTWLILFDGIMDAEMYVHILEKALLPSARKLYPGTNYLFMQDNDP